MSNGLNSSTGEVTRAVSERWHALDDDGKEHYHNQAFDDRIRFQTEAAERDREIAERQAAAREARNNFSVSDEPRRSKARNAYNSNLDYEESKRPIQHRQISEEELASRNMKRREKAEKDKRINDQKEVLRKERAAQAKKRLQYLLKQSDIFEHFGNVKEDGIVKKNKKDTKEGADIAEITRHRHVGELSRHENTEEEAVQEAVSDAVFLTSQPTTLGFGTMRAYQVEGLNWMIGLQENGVNGILADEMGLGKTLQSISVLVYMLEFQDIPGPHLIVVPKSTLSNWMNEIKRWAPTLRGLRFHGSKEDRQNIIETRLKPGAADDERDWDICVTTYEVVNTEKNTISKIAWHYLIIDEAHRLKNEASAFSQTVRTFETRYRLLLTGTPLQNNLHELWALLNFLVPDVFASSDQFDEWFNLDTEDTEAKNKLIMQLHKILRPFMLRRLKADVEKSLPPKHETILYCGMSKIQKKLYKDILMRDIDLIQGNGAKGTGKTAVLNIVMQLRKCAGHPYLFPGVEDRTLPPLGEHLVENCGKMVLLDKLLCRLKEKGHRVLVFTQMTKVLDILEDYLVMRRFQYCRIDGNTSYDVREDSIDKFNAPNSEKFLFLLSTRAGGLGINLQTADIVILYDSDWNPQADLQAQDRAHRIGQKRAVQVFRIVTEHTVEEKIVERAQQKLKLDAMVVQQGRLKDKDKLSTRELLDAVRFGADKVFKSKDSSITDDDIDLILDAGRKRTEELNEKLKKAEKGDLLDFKLGTGDNVQTFEGIDYSQQKTREMIGILDLGKRERNAVANYNEDFMYKKIAQQNTVRRERKKQVRLPKHLRLPRMEDWQLFDREELRKIEQKEAEKYQELLAEGKILSSEPGADLPALLDEETAIRKNQLLAEGFVDWNKLNFYAFKEASSRYGRYAYKKIALEVEKPIDMVEEYAKSFWSEDIGKKRMSANEYEKVSRVVEKGEKKLQEISSQEKNLATFISLFDNPWAELEFTFAQPKDKAFTIEEDRHLLCWTRKFGLNQWDAIHYAIRKSHTFRWNYHIRSLTAEAIGRRCEQLLRAIDKEIEILEKKVREESGLTYDQETPIELPRFSLSTAEKKKQEEETNIKERTALEEKLAELDAQIHEIKKRLAESQSMNSIDPFKYNKNNPKKSLLSSLVDFIARNQYSGITVIAEKFASCHSIVTKRQTQNKIDEIAVKEKREYEDKRIRWYINEEYLHLLDNNIIEKNQKDAKGKRKADNDRGRPNGQSKKRSINHNQKADQTESNEEIPSSFPEYDGSEEPKEPKKAFTHFCYGTRKEVKESLPTGKRKNKNLVNKKLLERWKSMSSENKIIWKKWEAWDRERYKHEQHIFENPKDKIQKLIEKEVDRNDNLHCEIQKRQNGREESDSLVSPSSVDSIPKKRKTSGSEEHSNSFRRSIPKKRRDYA